MRDFITGFPGALVLIVFIFLGIGLIIPGMINDGLILWGIPGIIFLFLAAITRVLRDILRRTRR